VLADSSSVTGNNLGSKKWGRVPAFAHVIAARYDRGAPMYGNGKHRQLYFLTYFVTPRRVDGAEELGLAGAAK
jgi:hypothetical protein